MKGFVWWLELFLFVVVFSLSSCTEEPLLRALEDDVRTTQVSKDFSALITLDSTSIKRDTKDGSQVQTSINYQAQIYEDIDSIQWIFEGGTPPTISQVLNPSVDFTGYGNFPSQIILTKYDTLSDNKIVIQRDTVSPNENLKVYFEEKNWDGTEWSMEDSTSGTSWNPQVPSSTTSQTGNTWTSFPFSNMVILKETNILTKAVPYRRTANFSGFNNQRIRISFDYKVSQKVTSRRFTGNSPKFDMVVNGFSRLQINKTLNNEYQAASVSISEATDFDIEIIKYPGLAQAAWELTPTSLPAVCQPASSNNTASATSTATASATTSSSAASGTSTSSSSSQIPNNATGSSTGSNTSSVATVDSVLLFEESTNLNRIFGYVSVPTEKGYFYLQYNAANESYIFGTYDQSDLILSAPCPIELSQGNYKLFVTLDEGFPVSFNAVKLGVTATLSTTILEPYFFDLYIKNFKIEAY
jgi:hypothetical protein